MDKSKIKRFWEVATISGMISSVAYVLHVFIGEILWDEYSPIQQAISDLTSMSAPNVKLLRVFTNIYGIFAIIFAISLYIGLRSRTNKFSKIGVLLLILMEISLYIGYSLFPLDGFDAGMTFQNKMHIVVTAFVVITTIGCTFIMGLGFCKIESMKKLGIFVIACGSIITISGAFTGIVMANNIPVLGLIERINIFTLQLMIFVLSFSVSLRKTNISMSRL